MQDPTAVFLTSALFTFSVFLSWTVGCGPCGINVLPLGGKRQPYNWTKYSNWSAYRKQANERLTSSDMSAPHWTATNYYSTCCGASGSARASNDVNTISAMLIHFATYTFPSSFLLMCFFQINFTNIVLLKKLKKRCKNSIGL